MGSSCFQSEKKKVEKKKEEKKEKKKEEKKEKKKKEIKNEIKEEKKEKKKEEKKEKEKEEKKKEEKKEKKKEEIKNEIKEEKKEKEKEEKKKEEIKNEIKEETIEKKDIISCQNNGRKVRVEREKDEAIIKIGNPYGLIDLNDNFWNDDDSLNNEIENYKIINIKILFNSEYEIQNNNDKKCIDEKNIVGLKITYKNIYTGDTKILTHQSTDKISGMKELVIQSNDYLKQFKISFYKDNNAIAQISFITNMKKEISVGINQGNEIIDNLKGEDNILVGFFGYFKEKINSIGGIYVSKITYIKKLLFGFFLLRNILKNKKFKENWDIKINKLDSEFQYIWKTVNLPDTVFALVMKYCSI